MHSVSYRFMCCSTESAGQHSFHLLLKSLKLVKCKALNLTRAQLRGQFCYCTPTPSLLNQVIIATLNAATHHFDGHTGQVLISDGGVITFHHIYSFSGKAVDDGHVGLE